MMTYLAIEIQLRKRNRNKGLSGASETDLDTLSKTSVPMKPETEGTQVTSVGQAGLTGKQTGRALISPNSPLQPAVWVGTACPALGETSGRPHAKLFWSLLAYKQMASFAGYKKCIWKLFQNSNSFWPSRPPASCCLLSIPLTAFWVSKAFGGFSDMPCWGGVSDCSSWAHTKLSSWSLMSLQVSIATSCQDPPGP